MKASSILVSRSRYLKPRFYNAWVFELVHSGLDQIVPIVGGVAARRRFLVARAAPAADGAPGRGVRDLSV
jgi:hypothetical protein